MQTTTSFQAILDQAVGVLKGKGVVAFPTDTLYGLGADAFSVEAVDRVFEIKGRPKEMALPILLGTQDDLEKVAIEIPEVTWTLVKAFWPGPLTLILHKSPAVPQIVSGGKESIAVRMPNHEVPLYLVQKLGRPITGTSANPSGAANPASADEVRELLGTKVDYIVDVGPATSGASSTILDLTQSTPRIVRAGPVSYESLQAICSSVL